MGIPYIVCLLITQAGLCFCVMVVTYTDVGLHLERLDPILFTVSVV